MTTVRASVLTGPMTWEIREFPVPEVTQDTATIRVELCGACGTDLKTASGTIDAPYPMILGHEIVGRIEAIGPVAAQRYRVAPGDRILLESSIPCWSCDACRSGAYRLCPTKGGYGTRRSIEVAPGLWGGMAELVYVAPGSILHRLPETMAPATGVGIPLLANGIQWLVKQGGLRQGDRALVQGCGPQGLAAALAGLNAGAREVTVTGLASDEARLAFARGIGARAVVVDPAWSRETMHEVIGTGFDVVLDVSGSPSAIAGAPGHLRIQGTFVLAGLAGRSTTVPLATDELVWRELRIQGVLSKDETAIRAALAVAASDPAVADALGRIVTHVFPLEEAEAAVTAIRANLDGFVKAAIRP